MIHPPIDDITKHNRMTKALAQALRAISDAPTGEGCMVVVDVPTGDVRTLGAGWHVAKVETDFPELPGDA